MKEVKEGIDGCIIKQVEQMSDDFSIATFV